MSHAVQRQTNQMPPWLMSPGVAFRIVGAAAKKQAKNIGESIGRLRSKRPRRIARRAAFTVWAVRSRRWEQRLSGR